MNVQKLSFEICLRFIGNRTYTIILFIYISFAMYHSLRNWWWIQQMNSGSRTIYFQLILSFSVCHGKIDFIEN